MEKEEIKKEVSDWFYKKHYYCKDVDSMLTFTAQSVIDEIVEFTTQIVKNNGVLDDVSNRRELLKKWWKYFDEESVAVNCDEHEREEVINHFFNCG